MPSQSASRNDPVTVTSDTTLLENQINYLNVNLLNKTVSVPDEVNRPTKLKKGNVIGEI